MHCSFAPAMMLCLFALLLTTAPLAHAQSRGPTDWADWERYRKTVVHPAAAIKPEDLERARRNIARYDWAKRYAGGMRKYGDTIAKKITPAYLERMVEITTPATTGPCPACRAKGLPWHPNGQWAWTPKKPDQLTCRVCKTVFPNDAFPESVVLQSKWDPRQKFSFVGGDTFKCFGYRYERPSHTGMIRARKLAYVTSQLYNLATAYALTQQPSHARACKAILLRFAEVLPKYLVYAGYGYGEYADCDPHVAAERIMNLPVDELVYPPNKPDRKLWTGYWSASRIGSSGMDGGWVCRVAEAYDLTCEAMDGDTPVYSEAERIRIERDVLLEGAYLALCDRSINNKSVGNRAGAAMVGLVVGHPGMVRFGIEGFRRTVDDWFLPDGGTSESAAYAMMTMSGVRTFGLAFRDYSDPEGYAPADGKRIEHWNACRDTLYGDCWQGLLWTLQGDLRFPPIADSYRTTSIGSRYAELLALCYPTDDHIALLKELSGDRPRNMREGIFYREPGLDTRDVPRLSLPDVVFPYLSQGYLRRGADGRQGVAVLNASDWGGHHHYDSLNLYYWQDGRELLSDLGYLWDHPDKRMTYRTLAHNLVLLDGQDQRRQGRRGSFHLFSATPRVKVMEASSRAYPKASLYRRTCIQVDHGEAGAYLVDIFRAGGGSTRDYLFHGPGNDYKVEGLSLKPGNADAKPIRFAVRFHLAAVGEIVVRNVDLRQIIDGRAAGPNLAAGPDVWSQYNGDGKGEREMTDDGVRFRALGPHPRTKRVNVALICGRSDGYRGTDAFLGAPSTTYRLRFDIRGNAKRVNMGIVAWPNNPASSRDRVHRRIKTRPQVAATDEWRTVECEFILPGGGLALGNRREANGSRPWRITWQVDDAYEFAAWSPGAPGEKVVIGDGWGQRDYRNTDRGATLPYVFRRRKGKGGVDTFVSVFAGAAKGKALVRGVKLLPLPAGAPKQAVAVAVETTQGTDTIVSQLATQALALDSPLGRLTTDARAAVVTPTHGCFVAGTRLSCAGKDLAIEKAEWSGKIASAQSADGDSWFVVDGELPPSDSLIGSTLFVTTDDRVERGYPIRDVRPDDAGTRIYTKRGHTGFEARPAKTWRVVSTVAWHRP